MARAKKSHMAIEVASTVMGGLSRKTLGAFMLLIVPLIQKGLTAIKIPITEIELIAVFTPFIAWYMMQRSIDKSRPKITDKIDAKWLDKGFLTPIFGVIVAVVNRKFGDVIPLYFIPVVVGIIMGALYRTKRF